MNKKNMKNLAAAMIAAMTMALCGSAVAAPAVRDGWPGRGGVQEPRRENRGWGDSNRYDRRDRYDRADRHDRNDRHDRYDRRDRCDRHERGGWLNEVIKQKQIENITAAKCANKINVTVAKTAVKIAKAQHVR